MNIAAVRLDDTYTASGGAVYMSGMQALVRLPMVQMRRDRAAGLNTAAFVTGYRGSPLGGYDQQLVRARKHLDPLDITFQPGVNEELAATAVWGTQQVGLSPGARKDGVLGIWYGKGPGVDRSGDVFKHGNAAGTAPHGGVLCLAGDDHTCKSSTVPHQSDHAFASAIIPCLYPSSIHEFLEIGLLGIAMSRYSGLWVGMKFISDTVETTSVVDLSAESRQFVIPDFGLPPGGVNLRWPDPPLVQDQRLQEIKPYAALAFARANGVDQITMDSPKARFGIAGSGKAYEDVRQALFELGIGDDEAAHIGLRLYKVRMTWPLEPEGVREFSEGLEEVLVVEERREIIENQIKMHLFNWRADVRPRIVGKFDEHDQPFLSLSKALSVGAVARGIADRVLRLDGIDDGLRDRIGDRLAYLEERERFAESHVPAVTRQPHYCAGCPHNTSTKVPEGSRALAGIGCHYMVQWMDRNTETFTQMGGEGVPWTAIGRYTDEKHVFVNLGDGTYFHSGILAIRQSVSAGANITYKLLYNDAVAMTGGQPLDGSLTPQQLTHQLHHEGVGSIVLMSDNIDAYSAPDLPPGTDIRHRDEIDAVMKELREQSGVTAIVYVQTCAAEKRRRRKRGLMEDPDMRVLINPAVCEGCGDCSVQSNCIAIDPLETEMGRKRTINQSACNKDFSCVKGFCPSFVTVRGGELRKSARTTAPDVSALPVPDLPEMTPSWNIAVTGVGGTGVLTIGGIIAMAARLENVAPLVLDMAGLAQKGGAVMSHIRLSAGDNPRKSPRIAPGGANVLIAADSVVAASRDGTVRCDPERTHAVVNARLTPVAEFVRQRDFDFRKQTVEDTVRSVVRPDAHFHDFGKAAMAVAGDEIATNILMVGFAWQKGLIPLSADAIEQAIAINGVAVDANIDSFRWGRVMAHDPAAIEAMETRANGFKPMAEMTADELVRHRAAHLAAYQNETLAKRYRDRIAQVASVAEDRLSRPTDRDALVRAVAHNYAKLLAYKDEYEVARLFADPAFDRYLTQTFTGDFRLSFNLAPPLLTGEDADGRPKKREFGPWMLRAMRLLARLKGLRGTRLDPFGFTAERRAERALIEQYEADVELALERLDEARFETLRDLLSVPEMIRGFGPVKEEAMAKAANERRRLHAELDRPPEQARLAEAAE
ncbi:MAG: indolepyruvate ferredoxin oxidoreductase family protein [Roseitalea sp.]|nr:indolepyruvate ferredoxin oxidoreductase family protein [Roseitalea sp.]MBO6950796.1 indolepyruvate ferredoxin oxidoreductase family protein [Rhizobiaceae bacterium]MBO6591217.1 indolepyruvate ferredoxin oxidoreductase family protein [Roseitalea sp.]MBO6599072.1 indolepyruvate ferredoxin oxidoreductase family protein [Roseitalea sp.]MBO6613482.1 indolepyruvate ferredoxin oxidoreductase family protein [Roseitalea sp.]